MFQTMRKIQFNTNKTVLHVHTPQPEKNIHLLRAHFMK